MKKKNFYKKVFPWLGASLYFFPNKTLDFFNLIETPEEILVNAKVDQINSFEKSKFTSTQNGNLELQNSIQDLNQTKVYLLVTKPVNKKGKKPTLLLLENENRLNSERTLSKPRLQGVRQRREKVNKKYVDVWKKFPIPLKLIHPPSLDLSTLIKREIFPIRTRRWATANSYNLISSKSICPVFFSKDIAEDFLMKTAKDTLSIANHGLDSVRGGKNIVTNVLNSKIISVGLGDFIHYYSLPTNEKFLNKIEFLFFPNLEDLHESNQEFINNLSAKNFSFYQNNYYKLKATTKK